MAKIELQAHVCFGTEKQLLYPIRKLSTVEPCIGTWGSELCSLTKPLNSDNMIDKKLSKDATLSKLLGEAVVVRDDWKIPPECGNAAAYTDPPTRYFIFCEDGLKYKSLSDILYEGKWKTEVSIGRWARAPASILLHELTHWNGVKDTDDVYGATSVWGCFNLPEED